MKIAVIKEDEQHKYITIGAERVIAVTDFSSNKNFPHHHFTWKANLNLEKALELLKKSNQMAKQYHDQQNDLVYPSERTIVLGNSLITDQLRPYQADSFFDHKNPISQVQGDDLFIGLITPYYEFDFYNAPLRTEKTENPDEAALSLGLNQEKPCFLKYVHDGTLHTSINRAQLSAYSNINEVVAGLITATSPHFEDDAFTKFLLRTKLDDPLSRYKKPIKKSN